MHSLAASLALLLGLGLAAGCGGGDDADEATADAVSIIGVPWLLLSGLDVDGWEATPPSATFTIDTVAGFSGCNRFTAPYTVDGDTVEIGQAAVTRMACPPPADSVEREYLAALGDVGGWRLNDDDTQLVLLADDGGELLTYELATPIGEWEATSFLTANAVSSVLAGTKITATFSEDGSLTGSSGCNTYRSNFETNRGEIEIGSPTSTEKACASPDGVMEQETAYLTAIPTAVRYRVEGTSLALLNASGTFVASFRPAPQP